MKRSRRELMHQDPTIYRMGVAASSTVPILVGAIVSPARESIPQAQAVLLLCLTVVLGAAVGGRAAGAAAAVTAALSFDFFFTQPYLSLAIASEEDIATTALLLAAGLVVGQLGLLSRRRRKQAATGRDELGSLFRVSRLAAGGAAPEDVETSVRAELLSVLALARCRFEAGPEDRPILDASGAITESTRHFVEGQYTLPDEGVALLVEGGGRRFGYIVCEPIPAVGVSIERRRVAVALADQLGLALAARAPHDSDTR